MDQQAWILRSFLVQLERQEARDEETPNGITGEFARLKSLSTKYRTDKTFPTKTAERQENIKKNRYKDIVPFDHSRVKLTLTTAKNDTDYINASFIKGVSGSRAYIATQGPLPHTVLDFLRMLWEYKVQVVVMACREFEMGKKKCERYWPQKQEQPFVCEGFTVHCDSEENKGDYLTRKLRLTYHNFTRTVKQLHYVNWPDHGVPDSIPPILEMLCEMRSYQADDDIPICIHCSAGCGRTGALCVIDYTWNLLKKQMITPDFSIFDLVQNMRTQRPSLVQTKEQYELVYRTIKLLFQRYLESMDSPAYRNEVTGGLMVPSADTPEPEFDLFDLSDNLDLLPKFQHLLDEERDASAQRHTPSPSTSEKQMELQHWPLVQAFPDTTFTSQDLQKEPRDSYAPDLVHVSQRAGAAQEGMQDIPTLNPPPLPAVAEAICLMVEDPYFDTPMTPPASEEVPTESTEDIKQWTVSPVFSTPPLFLNNQALEYTSPVSGTVEAHTDEEAAPPLPERTPESYVLALNTEPSDPFERLSVIIPHNAAAEAVRELGGSPPSPVPPLPERTPESFELAIDQVPVEQNFGVRPAVNLNRVGTSSEWSGNSKPTATVSQSETKPWVRSKSLRGNLTFTAVPVTHPDLASNSTSNLHPFYPPLDLLTRPLPPHDQDGPTPALPDRTQVSFMLNTEETVHETTALHPQPSETPRGGASSEWDDNSQPKKFLDVVMSRSKSVRPKSFQQEPLAAAQQLAPPPVVVAGAGSAQAAEHDVNRRSSLSAETSGNKPDKTNEKGMCRTKSLKFFRHKPKPTVAPPPPPNQTGTPAPTYSGVFSVFKFGFGHRFGKPKGPRSYPETWI